MFRRYCPPTSYSARVTCPSESDCTAVISASKMFSPAMAAVLQARRRPRRLLGVAGLEVQEPRQLVLLLLLRGPDQLDVGGLVAAASSARKVLTPMSGSSPECFSRS